MKIKLLTILFTAFVIISIISCENENVEKSNQLVATKTDSINLKCGPIKFPLKFKKDTPTNKELLHLNYFSAKNSNCYTSDTYGAVEFFADVPPDEISTGACIFAFKCNASSIFNDSITINKEDIIFICDSISEQFFLNMSSKYLALDYGTSTGIRATRIFNLENPHNLISKFDRVDDEESVVFYNDSVTYYKYLRNATINDDKKTYTEFDGLGLLPVLLEKQWLDLKTGKTHSLKEIQWTGFE